MKRIFYLAVLGSIALSARLPDAAANEYMGVCSDTCSVAPSGGCGMDNCDGCDDCRRWDICDSTCGTGGYFFTAEALIFQYFRSDGVRAGSFNNVPAATTDDIDFDHVATPRFTVGFVSDSGIGARLRYWEFAQSGAPVFAASGAAMTVDTYNLDFELFERFQVTNCWDVEISAGIRYNEFDESMSDPIPASTRFNSFTGFGGILGLEGIRHLGAYGSLYSRARFGILQDDHFVSNLNVGAAQNAVLLDCTHTMTELAFGYERTFETSRGRLFFGRLGYEWQHWTNFSSAFTPFTTAPANPPAAFAGQSDVGFGGVALALGVEF